MVNDIILTLWRFTRKNPREEMVGCGYNNYGLNAKDRGRVRGVVLFDRLAGAISPGGPLTSGQALFALLFAFSIRNPNFNLGPSPSHTAS
jgi:hypothetical protein